MARLALLALVGVLAVSGAFAADAMPEAVPNRGAVKAGRTLAQAVAPVYLDGADVDFSTFVPGDSMAGYYSAFPPLGPNNIFKAVFPGDGEALMADPTMTDEFSTGVDTQVSDNLAGNKEVYVLQPKLSAAASRRLLQSTPVEVTYAVEYPAGTTDAQLAAGREYMLNNIATVFPPSFTDQFGLETPTVTVVSLSSFPSPPPPGQTSATSSPPPRPPPPSGSAGRTPLSLVMTLLALFGSAMLISLL